MSHIHLVVPGHMKQKCRGITLETSDNELLLKMAPKWRKVLEIYFTMPADEKHGMVWLAERLNVPKGTAKSRLHRARAMLIELREKHCVASPTLSLPG